VEHQELLVSATNHAYLAAALIGAGVLQQTETGYTVTPGMVYSPCPDSIDGSANAFVIVAAQDTTQLNYILGLIPLDIKNRPGAPLKVVAGKVATQPLTYSKVAFADALEDKGQTAAWQAAITAILNDSGNTAAEKRAGLKYASSPVVSWDYNWFKRIRNQMFTTLALTNPQKTKWNNDMQAACEAFDLAT
jgi:hypothetical protein